MDKQSMKKSSLMRKNSKARSMEMLWLPMEITFVLDIRSINISEAIQVIIAPIHGVTLF